MISSFTTPGGRNRCWLAGDKWKMSTPASRPLGQRDEWRRNDANILMVAGDDDFARRARGDGDGHAMFRGFISLVTSLIKQ